MSNPSAVAEAASYTLHVEVKKGTSGGGTVIMKVLSGSVPHCERDQSNFEVGKRSIPKSTAPVIYKHNRDRESLAGAGAEGRSKATSDLSLHTHTQTGSGTHSYSPKKKIHLLTSRDAHIPPKTHSLSGTNVCRHIHTHAKYRGHTSGVCCQDIIKTKSQPPLGTAGCDQSKALFQVTITFQLLKLMNSLCTLMKSSANEDDSVFVLFAADSKNNTAKNIAAQS